MKRYLLLLATVALAGLMIVAGHEARLASVARREEGPGPAVKLALPADPEAGLETPIPGKLPPFTLADRSGHATPISTWRGKSLILNFWATWCAPCRREMPLLESLSRELAAQDFRVIGIAVDQRDAVLAFADALHIDYPLLIGEQDALEVAAKLGVTSPAFPFTVFTDRRGQIVALYLGELHQAETSLILSVVAEVNRDQLGLDEAQHRIAEGLAKLKADSIV